MLGEVLDRGQDEAGRGEHEQRPASGRARRTLVVPGLGDGRQTQSRQSIFFLSASWLGCFTRKQERQTNSSGCLGRTRSVDLGAVVDVGRPPRPRPRPRRPGAPSGSRPGWPRRPRRRAPPRRRRPPRPRVSATAATTTGRRRPRRRRRGRRRRRSSRSSSRSSSSTEVVDRPSSASSRSSSIEVFEVVGSGNFVEIVCHVRLPGGDVPREHRRFRAPWSTTVAGPAAGPSDRRDGGGWA